MKLNISTKNVFFCHIIIKLINTSKYDQKKKVTQRTNFQNMTKNINFIIFCFKSNDPKVKHFFYIKYLLNTILLTKKNYRII